MHSYVYVTHIHAHIHTMSSYAHCTHTHTHTYMYTNTCIYAHIHTMSSYAHCTHTHTHTYMYTNTCIYTHRDSPLFDTMCLINSQANKVVLINIRTKHFPKPEVCQHRFWAYVYQRVVAFDNFANNRLITLISSNKCS